MKLSRLLLIVVLAIFQSSPKADILPEPVRQDEFSFLPDYCYDRIKYGPDINNPSAQRWFKLFGKSWFDIHHYCKAINFHNRALFKAKNKEERGYYLSRSEDNYKYMIKAGNDFVLMPEVFVKYGKLLEEKGEGGKAVAMYKRALEMRKDYLLPYAYLSDYYVSLGNKPEAINILKKGLEISPSSIALQKRLKRISR